MEQTIFTFSTNNFLWLCVLCFLREKTTSKHKHVWGGHERATAEYGNDPGFGVAEFGDNVMVIRCSMKRAVRVRVPLISDQAEVECHRGR